MTRSGTVTAQRKNNYPFIDLIGQVIEGDHGLRFRIIGLGKQKNTVRLKSEQDGTEFELHGIEAQMMLMKPS
jgi:hypothetical protein